MSTFIALVAAGLKGHCPLVSKRIVTIHEGGRGHIGFPTKCGGTNRGDIPRVPKAPGDVPKVDPDLRG